MSDTPSGNKLANYATNAIFGIGGAILLSAAGFFVNLLFGPVGIGVGAVLGVLGLSELTSPSAGAKRDGLVVAGTGAVIVCIGLGLGPLRYIAREILHTGSMIALIWGVVSAIRFIIGARKRV